jgi:hypothetical protein
MAAASLSIAQRLAHSSAFARQKAAARFAPDGGSCRSLVIAADYSLIR